MRVSLGDFNVDLLKIDEQLPMNLLGVTSSFGLSQLGHEPTRVCASSSSLIDHVYASASPSISSLLVGAPLGSSDHCSLRLCLSQFSVQKIPPLKCRIWLYSKADFEGLNDRLCIPVPIVYLPIARSCCKRSISDLGSNDYKPAMLSEISNV